MKKCTFHFGRSVYPKKMSPTISRYQANWRAEVNSAALYRTLADQESQPQIAQVYRRLAAVEERHARFWEQKVRAAGHAVPVRQLDWQTRVLMWMTKRFGAQFVLPVVTTKEHGDQRSYDTQPESQASTLPADERSHARLLDTITKTSAVGHPGSARGAPSRYWWQCAARRSAGCQ